MNTVPEAPVVLAPRAFKQIVLFGSRFANNELDPPRWAEVYGFLLGHKRDLNGEPQIHVVSIVPFVHGTKNEVRFTPQDYALAEDAVTRASERGLFLCGALHSLPGKPLATSPIDILNLGGFPDPLATTLLFDPLQVSGENYGLRAFRLRDRGATPGTVVDVPVIVEQLDPVFLAKTLMEVSTDAAFQRPLIQEYHEVFDLVDETLKTKYVDDYFPEFRPVAAVPVDNFLDSELPGQDENANLFAPREEWDEWSSMSSLEKNFFDESNSSSEWVQTPTIVEGQVQEVAAIQAQIANRIDAGGDAGDLYMALGQAYEDANRKNDALQAYAQAKDEFLSRKNVSSYLTSLNARAQVLLDLNYLDAAIEELEDARQFQMPLVEDSSHLHARVLVLNTLGLAYLTTRNLDRAYEALKTALNLAQQVTDQDLLFGTITNLATVFIELTQFKTAIGLLVRTVLYYRVSGNFYGEKVAETNLAKAYLALGSQFWPVAQSLLVGVVSAGESVAKDIRLEAFEALAQGELKHGDPTTSLSYAVQALQVARDSSNDRGELRLLKFLGDLYLEELGDVDNALSYFQYALEIARDVFDDREELLALHDRLAHLFADSLQDLPSALDHLNQALLIAEQTGDTAAQARFLGKLGFIHERGGDLLMALRSFEQARELYQILQNIFQADQMDLQVERIRSLEGSTSY